jgi:hypothetical protein
MEASEKVRQIPALNKQIRWNSLCLGAPNSAHYPGK